MVFRVERSQTTVQGFTVEKPEAQAADEGRGELQMAQEVQQGIDQAARAE